MFVLFFERSQMAVAIGDRVKVISIVLMQFDWFLVLFRLKFTEQKIGHFGYQVFNPWLHTEETFVLSEPFD